MRTSLRYSIVMALLLHVTGSAFGAELSRNPPKGFYDEAHRLVFFAVLEGCYSDGLADEDIDLIIPKLENGRRIMTVNFVFTCPLCGPAFDAFSLYAERKRFMAQKKTEYNTFGPGLDQKIQGQLATLGKPCRDAIQGLIRKWVDARIRNMRLTDDETGKLRQDLARMRKEGEEALKRFQKNGHGEYYQKIYKDWQDCPICLGASPMGGEN